MSFMKNRQVKIRTFDRVCDSTVRSSSNSSHQFTNRHVIPSLFSTSLLRNRYTGYIEHGRTPFNGVLPYCPGCSPLAFVLLSQLLLYLHCSGLILSHFFKRIFFPISLLFSKSIVFIKPIEPEVINICGSDDEARYGFDLAGVGASR